MNNFDLFKKLSVVTSKPRANAITLELPAPWRVRGADVQRVTVHEVRALDCVDALNGRSADAKIGQLWGLCRAVIDAADDTAGPFTDSEVGAMPLVSVFHVLNAATCGQMADLLGLSDAGFNPLA